MNEKSETFVVHMASLNLVPRIHLDKAAQITSLFIKEVKIPDEYSDFADVFLEEKALVLPERTKLNEHTINLEDGKQPPYGPIYSLGPVELKTLKTYIETYLKLSLFDLPSLLQVHPYYSIRSTQLDLTSAYYQMMIKEGDKWKTAF